MHASLSQTAPTDGGRGIRGTFIPDRGPADGRSMGSGLAKLALVVIAIGVARAVIGHGGRHGGGESRMGRRRQMIADLHRQLHAEGATEPEKPDAGSSGRA